MLTRTQGGLAASLVTLLVCGLVGLDIGDEGVRRWWAGHALTTDVVAGVLVLLLTLLVVDQLVRNREQSDRARAVGAQAVIVLAQARRAATAVEALLDGSGAREDAFDELRMYMMMLLVVAPVFIDAPIPRRFLEQAQRVGGELARLAGAVAASSTAATHSRRRLDEAVEQLRAAATPLLQALDVQGFIAADPSLAGSVDPTQVTSPAAGDGDDTAVS